MKKICEEPECDTEERENKLIRIVGVCGVQNTYGNSDFLS